MYRHLYFNNNRVKNFRLTLYSANGEEKTINAAFGDNLCGAHPAGGIVTIDYIFQKKVDEFNKNKKQYDQCVAKKNKCILDVYSGGERILLKNHLKLKNKTVNFTYIFRGKNI